jgi:hypothetical protein
MTKGKDRTKQDSSVTPLLYQTIQVWKDPMRAWMARASNVASTKKVIMRP